MTRKFLLLMMACVIGVVVLFCLLKNNQKPNLEPAGTFKSKNNQTRIEPLSTEASKSRTTLQDVSNPVLQNQDVISQTADISSQIEANLHQFVKHPGYYTTGDKIYDVMFYPTYFVFSAKIPQVLKDQGWFVDEQPEQIIFHYSQIFMDNNYLQSQLLLTEPQKNQIGVIHNHNITERFVAKGGQTEQIWHIQKPINSSLTIKIPFTTSMRHQIIKFRSVPDKSWVAFKDQKNKIRVVYSYAKVIDSAQNTLIVEPYIENDSIIFTIPSSFLQSAQYPVVIDPTIGATIVVMPPETGNYFGAFNQWAPDVAFATDPISGISRYLVVYMDRSSNTWPDDYYDWWKGTQTDIKAALIDAGTGSLITQFSIDTAPFNSGEGLRVASDGSMFVVAWGKWDPASQRWQVWIAGIDISGSILWQKQLSSGTGSSYGPAIAYASDALGTGSGGFLVVYNSYNFNNASWDIVAQRINSSGVIIDPPICVTNQPNDQYWSSVASNGSNKFLVAWHDYRTYEFGTWDPKRNEVYASRLVVSTAGAISVQDIDPFDSDTTTNPLHISRSTDDTGFDYREGYINVGFGNGNWLVVWRNDNGRAYAVRVSAADAPAPGDPPTWPILDVPAQATGFWYPGDTRPYDIEFNGTYFAVTFSKYPPWPWNIYGAIIDAPSSSAISIAVKSVVPLISRYGDQWTPRIALNAAAGQFYLTWEESWNASPTAEKHDWPEILGKRISSTSLFDVDPTVTKVSGGARSRTFARVASNGPIFLVVWHDWILGWPSLWGARFDASTETIIDTSGFSIAELPWAIEWFDVASDGDNFLVVYQDPRFWWREIRCKKVSSDGSLGMELVVDETVNFRKEGLKLTFGAGQYFVVYHRASEDVIGQVNWNIWGARIMPSGQPVDFGGFPINLSTGDQIWPDITFDGTNFFVAWSDSRTGNWDIFGARVRPDTLVIDVDGFSISDSVAWQHWSKVSYDGSNYVVVWEEDVWWRDIRGQVVSPQGATLFGDGFYVTCKVVYQMSPAIASSQPTRRSLIAWTDQSEPQPHIRVNIIETFPEVKFLWGLNGTIASASSTEPRFQPAVAFSQTANKWFVVFRYVEGVGGGLKGFFVLNNPLPDWFSQSSSNSSSSSGETSTSSGKSGRCGMIGIECVILLGLLKILRILRGKQTLICIFMFSLAISIFAQMQVTQPEDEGLVLYLTFNSISGTQTPDSSLEGNNAELVNSPTLQSGIVGSAMRFSPTASSYAFITDRPSLRVHDFTITCWFNISSYYGHIIGKDLKANSVGVAYWAPWADSYVIWISGTNTISAAISEWGGAHRILSYSNITTGTWTFLAFRKNKKHLSLFINGNKVAERFDVPEILVYDNSHLYIGADDNNDDVTGDGILNGVIDELRIYNRPLDDGEIRALYERKRIDFFSSNESAGAQNITVARASIKNKKTIPSYPSGVIARFDFDQITNVGGVDKVLNAVDPNNNLVVNGTPKVVKGLFSNAIDFDTGDDYLQFETPLALPEWTVSVWVYFPLPYTGVGWRTIIEWGHNRHHIMMHRDGWLGVYHYGFYNSNYNVNHLRGWHNLIAVGKGNKTFFYIDGEPVGESNFKEEQEMRIVGNHVSGGQNAGALDELVIYDKALTEDEIRSIANIFSPFVLNTVVVIATGDLNDATDVEKAKLVVDVNQNGIVDSPDYILKGDKFTVDNGSITFQNIGFNVKVQFQPFYIIVAYDLSSEISGNPQFSCLINNVNGTITNIAGYTKTISQAGSVLVFKHGNFLPERIVIPQETISCIQFSIKLSSVESATLNEIRMKVRMKDLINLDAYLTNFRLYEDTNENGILDPQDNFITQSSLLGGEVAFSGFSFSMERNTKRDFLVICTLSEGISLNLKIFFSITQLKVKGLLSQQILTVVGLPIVSAVVTSQRGGNPAHIMVLRHGQSPSSQQVAKNHPNFVVLKLTLFNTQIRDEKIKKIEIEGFGDVNENADIENVLVYLDTNNNGSLDSFDTLVSTTNFDSDDGKAFLDTNFQINVGQIIDLLIVMKFKVVDDNRWGIFRISNIGTEFQYTKIWIGQAMSAIFVFSGAFGQPPSGQPLYAGSKGKKCIGSIAHASNDGEKVIVALSLTLLALLFLRMIKSVGLNET